MRISDWISDVCSSDLPSLVAAVKGYAGHEAALLEAVTALRARATAERAPGRLGDIEGELEHALGRLVALQEAYPDLKAARTSPSCSATWSRSRSTCSTHAASTTAPCATTTTRCSGCPTCWWRAASTSRPPSSSRPTTMGARR